MSNLQLFSQETAIAFLNSGEKFPIDFDDAWQWLGYSTKASAKRKLTSMIDGVDFSTMMLESQNGRPSELIKLSVDAFKNLGMLAGTEKGRQVRRYFLECEAISKKPKPVLPQNFIEALEGLIKSEKEKLVLAAANQQLEQEKKVLVDAIAITKPKAEFYDIYVNADGWLTGEQIAKQLSVSTRKMFDALRNEKVIYSRSGKNLPCADWVNKGLATMSPVRCHDEIVRSNLVFSHKSIMQIFDLLQEVGLIDKNRNYQLHFVADEPKQMKRA
jgi:phage antirepressor YoqD-like protein